MRRSAAPSPRRSAAPSAGCRRSGAHQMKRSPVQSTRAAGKPHEGVVVGLAAGVGEARLDAADLERDGVVVQLGRADRLRRPAHGHPELARVHDLVVARGLAVAVHALRHRAVGDDARRRPALGLGLGEEGREPVGVVHVAVGVDRGVDALRRVAAHAREAPLVLRRVERSGVDEQHAVRRSAPRRRSRSPCRARTRPPPPPAAPPGWKGWSPGSAVDPSPRSRRSDCSRKLAIAAPRRRRARYSTTIVPVVPGCSRIL